MELQTALYMVPVPISEGAFKEVMPEANAEIVSRIKHFIVENTRTARRFLKKLNPAIDISSLTFNELNGHTPENEISGYLNPLREGQPIAVLSEAGCPGVADPGAAVVEIAQREGLKVVPLVGPSSILLALMASGMNGQKFCFNGYLPVDDKERARAIRDLEAISRRNDMTQIFIETPYRNARMMETLLSNLSDETLLCVAEDITSPSDESIRTKRVKRWRSEEYHIKKVPAIFLFYCSNPKNVKIRK